MRAGPIKTKERQEGRLDVPFQTTKTEGKNRGGEVRPCPPCSSMLSNAHVLDQWVGSAGPDYRDRTMRRPSLPSEARGRCGRALMLLVVGGGVIMIDRACSSLAEGGRSTAGVGAGIIQGNA